MPLLMIFILLIPCLPLVAAAQTLQIGVTDTTEYGRNYGDNLAIDKHTTGFGGSGQDLTLAVDGYDINAHYEVNVLLNGVLLGKLSPGAPRQLKNTRFFIPAEDQLASNTLEFMHNSPDNVVWGVTNILLTTQGPPQLVVNERLDEEIGWYFGDNTNSDIAYFVFSLPQNSAVDVAFSANGFDIDWAGEVGVFVNGEFIDFLAPTPDDGLGGTQLVVPASVLGQQNLLTFRSSGWSWGVTDILLSADVGNGGGSSGGGSSGGGSSGGGSSGGGSSGGGSSGGGVVRFEDNGEYGRNFGSDQNPTGYSISFSGDSDDVVLTVNGYDINAHYEVEVTLNGEPLGNLTPGAAFDLSPSSFFIPRDRLRNTNTIAFTHNSDNPTWGVTNILVTTGGPPSLSVNSTDTAAYGWQYGESRHHRRLYFRFDTPSIPADPVLFSADGWNISWSQEVAVLVNGNPIGFLAPSSGDATAPTSLEVPVSVLQASNLLELRAAGFRWGVSNLRISAETGNQNTPPVISQIADRSDDIINNIDFMVTASDADANDHLTFALSGAPPGISIDADSGRVFGKPSLLGNYVARVTVTDLAGAQDSAIFNWEVISRTFNNPPQITQLPNREELAGVNVRFTVEASDSNADRFTFAVSGGPAGITIDPISGIVAGSPTVAGVYNTRIVVTDARGGQSETGFTWNVLDNPLLNASNPATPLTPNVIDSTSYGFAFGDERRWTTAEFTFNRQAGDLELEMRGYDADLDNEIKVSLNGDIVGYLPRAASDSATRVVTFFIPTATQQSVNTLQIMSQNPGDPWGITDVQLKPRQTGPAAAGETEQVINPGDNLAQRVRDGSAPGDVFRLTPGIHRLVETVYPKPRQRFYCEPGAVISGAVVLNGPWTDNGGNYSLSGAPLFKPGNGAMQPGRDINKGRNDLFISDIAYLRVDSLDKVNNIARVVDGETIYAGTFYQEGDVVFVASDPGAGLVEMSDTRFAFQQWDTLGDDVTIENCVIEKFATNDLEGAVDAKYTRRWLLKNVTGRYNHTAAVRIGRSTSIIGGRYIKNGQPAITGQLSGEGGPQFGYSDNVLIDDVELAYNTWVPFSIFWHSGGVKLFRAQGVIIRNSRIHHNEGPGIWTDIDVLNTHIDNNAIYANSSNAIKLEATYFGEINDNEITCNSTNPAHNLGTSWFWGAALFIQNSQGFAVRGNEIVIDLGDGIGLVDNQDRGSYAPYGPRRSIDNTVTDNDIIFSSRERTDAEDGITGIETDEGARLAGYDAPAASANNTMNANRYVLSERNRKHWKFYNFFFAYNEIDPDEALLYPPEYLGIPWDVLYERDATLAVRSANELSPQVLCDR